MSARPGERLEPPFLIAAGSFAAPPAPQRRVPPRSRWSELDGHRAIAVIGVVVSSVYQFCNVDHFLYRGTLGYTVLNSLGAMVPWLFVLSAFLLFEPIARAAINAPQSLSARGFLTRRAIRLLPLYYLAVIVVWFSRQSTLPGDWRDLLEHLTFTQVFDEKRIFYTIGPAWAISVEVLFCLFLAALIVGLRHLCGRVAGRRQRIALLLTPIALMSAVSLSWKAYAFAAIHDQTTGSFAAWFGPLSNLDSFAVGMTIAVLVAVRREQQPIGRLSRMVLRVCGAVIVCVAFAACQANAWTGVYFPTICAIGFGSLVAAAVMAPPDRWSQKLSCRPLLWLSTISYSIYIWHEPILLALGHSHDLIRQSYGAFIPDAIVILILSIAAAAVSYLLIQRPTCQLEQIAAPDRQELPADLIQHVPADGTIRLRNLS